MKRFAIALLFPLCVCPAFAKKHQPTNPQADTCKTYFMVVENDGMTSGMPMVGLNEPQRSWYKKEGGKYPELCLVNGNASGKPVSTDDVDQSYMDGIVGDSPFYAIVWEEHQVVVPDNKGGHYAWSANGRLMRWDATKKDLVNVTPIHNTNHTIFSSSSTSLLKDGLKEIQERTK